MLNTSYEEVDSQEKVPCAKYNASSDDKKTHQSLTISCPDHTYEQAELIANEDSSTMYDTLYQDVTTNQKEPTTRVSLSDLYAKPMKDKKSKPKGNSNYETVDEDFKFNPNANPNCDNGTVSEKLAQNGCVDKASAKSIEDMYAKPIKKRKDVARQDSFDDTCMVENELYSSHKTWKTLRILPLHYLINWFNCF